MGVLLEKGHLVPLNHTVPWYALSDDYRYITFHHHLKKIVRLCSIANRIISRTTIFCLTTLDLWHDIVIRHFISTSVILLDGPVPLCTYDSVKIKIMNWMIDLSHLKNLDKGTLARLALLVRWFEIQILLENGRKLKTLTSFTDSSYYFKRINDCLEVNHKRQEDSLLFCTRQYFGRIRPPPSPRGVE